MGNYHSPVLTNKIPRLNHQIAKIIENVYNAMQRYFTMIFVVNIEVTGIWISRRMKSTLSGKLLIVGTFDSSTGELVWRYMEIPFVLLLS